MLLYIILLIFFNMKNKKYKGDKELEKVVTISFLDDFIAISNLIGSRYWLIDLFCTVFFLFPFLFYSEENNTSFDW